jgi:hypothetical protein
MSASCKVLIRFFWEASMNARMAAVVVGIVLAIVGLLGFIGNPIVSGALDATGAPSAWFYVNTAHTIVHFVSGIFLLVGAWTALGSVMALRILGIVYVVVALLSFLGDSNLAVLTFVSNSQADRWLHVVVAIVLLAAGFGLSDDEPAMSSPRM